MNDLLRRIGIQHPIIQAPMAGGATTPQLVTAVSNAGGLGFIARAMARSRSSSRGSSASGAKRFTPKGAAYLSPADIESFGRRVRELTDRARPHPR